MVETIEIYFSGRIGSVVWMTVVYGYHTMIRNLRNRNDFDVDKLNLHQLSEV